MTQFSTRLTAVLWFASTMTLALGDATTIPVAWSELPPPPADLSELLGRTPLTWESGPREVGDRSPGEPRRTAETKYVVNYSFATDQRWRYDRAKSKLRISLRFTKIDWRLSHRIWLERLPPDDTFWSDPIVRHELDHLRISSDPRHASGFKVRLRETKILERSVAPNERVDQAYIDRVIEDHVKNVFRDHVELINIRYQELDRVSRHGQIPIPVGSPLAELLEQASQPGPRNREPRR